MVRPGPKTGLEDVKAAVLRLLEEHPDGLNFNEVFRRLKSQKVLGSFSVLSRAMKDLTKSGVVEYEDVREPAYKIPKRIYILAPEMENALKGMGVYQTTGMPRAKEVPVILEEALKELGITECADAILMGWFLVHAVNLAFIHKLIVSKEHPLSAQWPLLLRKVLEDQSNLMDAIDNKVIVGEVLVEKSKEANERAGNAIFNLITILTEWAYRLADKDETTLRYIHEALGLI